MKYIKKFEEHSQYDTFTHTNEFIKPNVSLCVQENEVHYNPYIHDYAEDYLTFVALEDGTFTFTPQSNQIINYSIDNGTTWIEGNSIEVNNGDKVLWKGTMSPAYHGGIGKFSSTAEFDIQGNIMSLLYGDNYKGQTDLTGKSFAFLSLFSGNTNVVNAKNLSLPSTTLAESCYSSMFQSCTSLTTAPVLSATTLAYGCYKNMFNGCTSLTTAPVLSATTLRSDCYSSMFEGCTGLTTAPILPATTLTESCYYSMFYGCTSLITAPELPATTLASSCYSNMFQGCTNLTMIPRVLPAETLASNCYAYMFSGCTSLTTAPELPATTMVNYCYSKMFQSCTSLTIAPELPATTLIYGCYESMFNGCSKLNYIKAMFTTTPSTIYTQSWVKSVAASGTFVKNSAATWNVSGVNGVPSGWTVQTASE